MRIRCPYCGDRSVEEFIALGAVDPVRPEASERMEDWIDYVYARKNPAGLHREWFYHASGCKAWLSVSRNTLSHEITDVAHAPKAEAAS